LTKARKEVWAKALARLLLADVSCTDATLVPGVLVLAEKLYDLLQ
jgi:hypothetical protein